MDVQFIICFVVLVCTICTCNGDFCQTGCTCAKNGRFVSCDKQGWSGVTAMTHNVTVLSLENNEFKTIPKELASLKIRCLYMSGNQFATIDTQSLKHLRSMPLWVLDVSRNPWDCSCSLELLEFFSWIQKVNKPAPSNAKTFVPWVAFVDGYNTVCATPPRLKGRRLDGLSKADICAAT